MGRRWMILVTAVLAVGQVRAQEPPSTAPPAGAEGPPTASVPDSSNSMLERPSLRSRLQAGGPDQPLVEPEQPHRKSRSRSAVWRTRDSPSRALTEPGHPLLRLVRRAATPARRNLVRETPRHRLETGPIRRGEARNQSAPTRRPWTSLRAPVHSGGFSVSTGTPGSALRCLARRLERSPLRRPKPGSLGTQQPRNH